MLISRVSGAKALSRERTEQGLFQQTANPIAYEKSSKIQIQSHERVPINRSLATR